MKTLAEVIKRAAQIREESFDHEAYGKVKPTERRTTIVEIFYRISLRTACDEAAEEVGFDTRGTEPVYLLLANSWNDALSWADIMKDKAHGASAPF